MIRKLFVRTLYFRFDEKRLRIDSLGAKGYDDAAAIAISDAGTAQAKVLAIGNAAEKLRGHAGTTVIHPFAHPRMLFGDHTVAEAMVKGAAQEFNRLQEGFFPRPSTLVIIHPLRKLEGGLTQIERRALLELFQNVGARKAEIYEGRELSPQEVEQRPFWQPQG